MSLANRRRALMAGAELIPASAWQIVTMAGTGSTSITFPATCDASKSYILFFESDATAAHATTCMKEGNTSHIVYEGVVLARAQNCYDNKGTIRSATFSVSANGVTLSTSSIQFASDVNYTLHYAEFVAE